MQPAPKKDERLVVDPRPGKRNRGTGRVVPNPGFTKKPGRGRMVPNPGMPDGGRVRIQPIDDKIYRTMPITEGQLAKIKKMYGI